MYGLKLMWPGGLEAVDGRMWPTRHEAWCAGRRWLRTVEPGCNFMVVW